MTRDTDDGCSELTIKKITAVFEAGGYLFVYLRLINRAANVISTIAKANKASYVTIQQNKVHHKRSSHHSFPVNSEGAKKPPSVKERSNRHRNGVPRVLLPKISISYWVGFVNSCHVTTKYLLLFDVIYFDQMEKSKKYDKIVFIIEKRIEKQLNSPQNP